LLAHGHRDGDVARGLHLDIGRHADVAVGEHPDDRRLSIDDGDAAAVALPHDPGRRLAVVLQDDALDPSRHDLLDSHGSSLRGGGLARAVEAATRMPGTEPPPSPGRAEPTGECALGALPDLAKGA